MKRMFAVLAMAFALAACSRLDEENYARLKAGMSYEEVTQIIGRADRCDETLGVKHCVWGNDEHGVTAEFVGGKALVFSSRNLR